MLRFLSAIFLAAVCAACAVTPEPDAANSGQAKTTTASARTRLQGVWKITELSSREIGGEWKPLPVNVSLYIFTEKHFSYMFVPGAAPRRLHAGDPNKPTDAEKVAAYESIVAASGTYVLTRSNLALTALLHKNPNEMLGEPLTYAIEIDGDVLRMTIVNAPFAPGRERRTTLERLVK